MRVQKKSHVLQAGVRNIGRAPSDILIHVRAVRGAGGLSTQKRVCNNIGRNII